MMASNLLAEIQGTDGLTAVRDLYDIGQVTRRLPALLSRGDAQPYRRFMLYHLPLSGPFPPCHDRHR